MDQREQVSEVLQLSGEQQRGVELTSDPSVLPPGSPDQTKQPTQGQEDDNSDEWDTDLETEEVTSRRRSLSRAELYPKACRQTGVIPIDSFLRNLSEASLNLNHYGVGPLGAKALAITLQSDSVITNLELEDNAIQAQGTRYLMEMLQTNNNIQRLNLSNNQLHLEGAIVISKMLSDNYCIMSLKLSGNGFDDSAAKYLADALKGDYVLKELDLSHNMICVAGGEHLGLMLARNEGIETLNLSWNCLCMKGVVALSAGLKVTNTTHSSSSHLFFFCTIAALHSQFSSLKVNSTLKRLQLSWNRLGHIEAESLGQALKKNNSLELLDLSSNNIDDESVMLLCQGLTTNNTLKVLKLSLNPLTNTGALTLLKTVQNNTMSALEEIDISTVFVYEAFVEMLEEVRQRRPALNFQYSIMNSVVRNLSALKIFQKFLDERNESMMDFFQALDKEETMKVSTSAFRTAVKAAEVPLDQQQLEWLTKKFDKSCTSTIIYSHFSELS